MSAVRKKQDGLRAWLDANPNSSFKLHAGTAPSERSALVRFLQGSSAPIWLLCQLCGHKTREPETHRFPRDLVKFGTPADVAYKQSVCAQNRVTDIRKETLAKMRAEGWVTVGPWSTLFSKTRVPVRVAPDPVEALDGKLPIDRWVPLWAYAIAEALKLAAKKTTFDMRVEIVEGVLDGKEEQRQAVMTAWILGGAVGVSGWLAGYPLAEEFFQHESERRQRR